MEAYRDFLHFSTPSPLPSVIQAGCRPQPARVDLALSDRRHWSDVGSKTSLKSRTAPIPFSFGVFLHLASFSRHTVLQLRPRTATSKSLLRSILNDPWLDPQPTSSTSEPSLLWSQAQSSEANRRTGTDPDDHGFQTLSPNSRGARPQDSHGARGKESARPPPKATGAPETAKEVGISPDNPRHGSRSWFGRPGSFDTEINDAVVENALPRGRGH